MSRVMDSRSTLGIRESRAIRLDGWIDRWVPGGKILLEQLDRIAVAYLERRYVAIGRDGDDSQSEDSTDRRGA